MKARINYNDGDILIKDSFDDIMLAGSVRTSMVSAVICTSGCMKIGMNGSKYEVAGNNIFILPPNVYLDEVSMDEKFKGSDPNLTYTLRKDGKDALLLVGNYQKRKEASTFLPLPGLTSATDCMTGKKISFDDKGINLHLDKYQARLLKLTF